MTRREGEVVLGCRGEGGRRKKGGGRVGGPCEEALGRRDVRAEGTGKV